MVSADSINYDVWEHIFAYLSTPDLASAAAVSRSLWTSALPFLYRTLHFHYSQLIVYPRVASPFAILRNRPFAAFTRNVDIRVIPQTSAGKKNSLDSGFLMDAHVAITSMPNLCSFICTVSSAIPSFLIPLQSKNLQYLHINAGLTAAQASELVKIEHLKTLVLDHAKSPVLNALPEWAERLKPTLRHLTIRSSPLLNRHVLSITLDKLPKLLGLHVLSCPLVSHAEILALIGSAPKLQSLACTVIDYASSIPETSLTGLKHLALDFSSSRRLPPPPLSASSQEDRPHPLSDILSLTHSLQSLVIQNAEPFNDDVLETLASDHYTLRYLAILGTPIDADSMSDIIAQCNDLERLSVPIPKDDEEFVYALAMSYSLHTLIDASVNGTHSHGVSLTTSSVVDIMEAVEPLRRVVSQNRLWTAHYGPQGKQVKFQRLKRAVNSDLWFMPPPEAGVEDCQSQF